MIDTIMSSFAQFDNDVRSERTIAGMKARLERGGWTFPPPLGYLKSIGADGKKAILPDSQRAPLISQAFELFATGLYSKQQVLEKVTALGLTTKAGKRVSPQTFQQLLRKPIYVGILCVPKWGINRPSNATPLVNKETFQRVQDVLDGKRPAITPRQRNHPDFPLRHFVRCGSCDRPLTASWSRGRSAHYAYYRCQKRGCHAVNIRAGEMERLFLEFLRNLQPKREYLRLFSEIIADVWKEKQAQARAALEAARRRVTALLKRKEQLDEAFIYRRDIDRLTYQNQLDKLNEEIALAEIAEHEAHIEQIDVQAALKFAEFLLLNAPRLWVELPLAQKQRLQQIIFPRGVSFDAGGYRTSETSMIFMELEAEEPRKEGLVALPGIEPGFED